MHCLAGLDTLTSGQVLVGDTDLASLSDRERTILRRDRLGFVFQSFNLLPTLTAEENITLPADLAGRDPGPRLDGAPWWPSWTSATGWRHRPSELSGGQQQRVAVARALIHRPDVVFADEPTGALDTKAGTELLRFLRSVVDELGQTVVMVTHDPGAAAYADRVVFLVDGAIVEELDAPDQGTGSRRHGPVGGLTMLRFSLRNLLVNKLRLLLTLAAVTVGVSFVSGTYRAVGHHGQGLRRAVRRPDLRDGRGGPGREPVRRGRHHHRRSAASPGRQHRGHSAWRSWGGCRGGVGGGLRAHPRQRR